MKSLLLGVAMLAAASFTARAQDNTVRIGVLNDQSSSFSAIGGTEVVRAVELAIKDHGGKAAGIPVELVIGDHQNKPEVGLAIADDWLARDKVDVIADMTNSAIALPVNKLIGAQGKVGLFVSPLTDRPTEEDCNGHVVAWAYDADSTIRATVKALLAQGHTSFFILSPDTEAGVIQEDAVATAVAAHGGAVKGKRRAPLGTTDFSSQLAEAEASGAEIVMMNISGADLVNAMKQVQNAGLRDKGMRIAVTFMHQADVRSIGVEAMQGVRFAVPWFWGKDEASRQWGRRMMAITGHAPGWIAAGTYSAVTNYLNAIDKAGTDDSAKVLDALDALNVADFFIANGDLLPNGRMIHDMYLVEVKTPAEVTEKEDFLKLVETVPAKQAFRPLSESDCKLR
ncbi:ABC transporter substrate-binding protein [Ancylobacter sp. Lp-2]|uniref:ABC transporter substrate-binding protein n=1 Tax=Ancylobacter sp. Lp-2 TaxID=2881339 RepID=UPI001E5E2711|nr:ABC transporter substrate-binding protein [Ancylobacter sp. Lp-2]MCB4771834.1 ABC transporter substrate-binding protein [Ancylobacter sp. Lp-2]